MLQSEKIKNFVDSIASKNMLVSAAFVASFFDVKNKNYNSFKVAWEEIKKIIDIDPVVKANIISFAYICNLPKEFIDIISN